MNRTMQDDSEFYIGWQAEAPPGFARRVRQFLLALCLLVPAVAALIVLFQSGFAGSTFEYGKKTELSGRYSRHPFPFLTVENGTDAAGKPITQKILLVAPGKFGFTTGPEMSVEDGSMVTASGFLIYHDGKTALEVRSINKKQNHTAAEAAPRSSGPGSGTVTLRGEITDPKCLLGVMKPGFGKPHRDCAARCIAGGIPPVLKVANAQGETEYYLLAGPGGEMLNDRILEFVGDGVQLCGRIGRESDWLVLYTDPSTIQRIHRESLNPGNTCN